MSDGLRIDSVVGKNESGSVGERYPASLWTAVIGVSLAVGTLHVFFNGDILLTLVLLGALGVGILSVMRPVSSFYFLLALAMAIEQYPPGWGWTLSLPYHTNLYLISPTFTGISVNPLELHLVCITAGVFLHLVILRKKLQRVVARTPMLLYAASLLFSLLYGLSRGGILLPALWEIRGIFYLFALAFIVPQIITEERQVRIVVWIIIGALTFRSAEVVTLYVGAGWSLGMTEGWGNHEDAGFLAAMFILLASTVVLRIRGPERRILSILFLPFAVAFIASGRRTVYGVVAVALIVLILMLERDVQRKVLSVAWKLAIVFAIYLAVFWNSTSTIALPARSIRMTFADNPETAGERYSSNLYRQAENYNLIRMIQKSPILGSGYGLTVDYSSLPMPLFWEMGFFIPHNQLLGVAAKTGVIGFVVFWFFYLSTLTEVAKGFRNATSPYRKMVLALVSAALVNHLVYSYFDIMLTYYRNNILLGSLLGLASVIIGMEGDLHGPGSAAGAGTERRP